MSLLGSSLVLYLLIGLGVAGAVYVTDQTRLPAERWFRVATAVPFWPLHLPSSAVSSSITPLTRHGPASYWRAHRCTQRPQSRSRRPATCRL